MWASETALGASHTFLLGQEPLTITVMARNSVGVSSNNHNLTLTKSPKREWLSLKTFCHDCCCGMSVFHLARAFS